MIPWQHPLGQVTYCVLCMCVSSVLLKVCNTLKHRSRDVRDVGRSTLVKMAASLGPKHLHYIVSEMKATLTRGYMVREWSWIHGEGMELDTW